MRRLRSVPALVLVTGVSVAAMFAVSPKRPAVAAEPAAPEPVTLSVESTRDIALAQSLPWVDAFVEPSLTSVTYRSVSSAQARGHLLAGTTDVAIVGTPFTDEERGQTKVGATIEVPIHVSTAMLLMSEPFSQGFEETDIVTPEENPDCDPLGDNYDASICETRTKFAGPVRVPHRNLAAMMLEVASDGLNRWRHPDVMAALGTPNLSYPSAADAPTFVHREPGESVNRYLQQYVTTVAPQVWELAKLANPGVPYEVDESVPRVLTRSTPAFQAQQVGLWQIDPKTGAASSSGWAGNVADVPPAVRIEGKEFYPLTPYRVIQMKNGADQWVEPTPESISKAVAAGGTKPLYALTNRVDGAYPLVWVDNLSVRAKGLSPEKVNAVAWFIRYVAVLGQKGAADLGEGKLSDPLVAEALRGAEAIVKSNCEGPDVRVVSTSDPGPYAPPVLAEVDASDLTQCERVPAEPPAPAATQPETSPPADETPFESGPELPLPSASDEGFPTDGATETALAGTPAAATGAQPERAPNVKLPYAVLAASSRGVDRLATIVLGALLFLLARSTLWPRIHKRLG